MLGTTDTVDYQLPGDIREVSAAAVEIHRLRQKQRKLKSPMARRDLDLCEA